MRAGKTTEGSTKWFFTTAACLYGLVLLLVMPGFGLAQVEEEQEQGPPPLLLLSSATTLFNTAIDRVNTNSGDPTNDFIAAISYFHKYLAADTSLALADSASVYSKIADSYYTMSTWAEANGGTPVWEDALHYYEWLIERETPQEDLPLYHFNVAYIKSRLEDWSAGTPHLEKYLELRPDDIERRVWVARIYLSIPDNNRALDHFLIYLDANPQDQEVVAEILNLRNRLQDRYEEITLKLAEKLPDTPKYLLDLSQHYLSRAQYDEGLDYTQRYLEKQPEDITGWKILGDEHKRLGQWNQALSAYRRVLAIDSREVLARCAIAEVYLEQGKIDETIREAKRALAIDPDNAYANTMMGDAGQQWAMREFGRRYPNLEQEKMKYDFKLLMKKLADDYYEKAKGDPLWRAHAQSQINYLTQFFPQPQDKFMWPIDRDPVIQFPPPR